MAWFEQCEVCGGGSCCFFCCHRSNRYPDLNQAACPRKGGGPAGLVQEFQFFGGPGGGIDWLGGDAGDGEVVSEDRTPQPPPPQPSVIAPAAWDSDGQWPALDGGSSVSASSKSALADAGLAGTAASAGAAVPICGGGFDTPHADATEAASSGKDEYSSSMDREARVLRYREKKKRRKFEKQIRYASRKAYAEARPRVRGRFVKAPEANVATRSSSFQPPLPPQYDPEQIDMGWLRAFRP